MDLAKQALDKVKIQLMSRSDSAFFTTVCFSLKHVWDTTIRTAATDGLSIKFNPEFFMSLSPEERLFLVLHETMHAAFLHALRLMGRDHKKWNIACDHVINLMLIERGFKMPKMGLADRQYSKMSAEEIYPLLPESQNQDFDMDLEAGPPEESEAIQQEMEDILIRASIQSKMQGDSPGTIPGEIQIFLDRLLNPKLPWQQILRKYIQEVSKNDFTFRKPNRRHFPDYYLPSLHSEKLMDLAIAVDISGSVSDDDFKRFISEINGILKMMKPEKISLVQFDTAIHSVDVLKNVHDLSKVQFKGRGGTAIEPVFEWANKTKPKVLMVFSDGDFYFSDYLTKTNTVWLIHDNKRFTAPIGKVIHYEMKG